MERRQDTLVHHIDAWVVLPDHLHCIWTLPTGDDDFSNRWKAIKIRFVQTIPQTERRSAISHVDTVLLSNCQPLIKQHNLDQKAYRI